MTTKSQGLYDDDMQGLQPPPPTPTLTDLQQKLKSKDRELKDEFAKQPSDNTKINQLNLDIKNLRDQIHKITVYGGKRQTRKKLNQKKRKSHTNKRRIKQRK